MPEPPLCVDLDGTLIRGDTLHVSFRMLVVRRPWVLPLAAIALLRGRAAMKDVIARHVVPDPARLHWRQDVVNFTRTEKSLGRKVYLATAAHRRVAEAVAEYLACFDGVIATEGGVNAKGPGKLAAIRRELGDVPFDYIGDTMADLPVLIAARKGYLVAPTRRLRKNARKYLAVERTFDAG
jgi:phosphoserine phosphatase